MEKKPYNPGIVGLDGKSWSQMKEGQVAEKIKGFSGTSFSQAQAQQNSQQLPTPKPQPTKSDTK